MAHSTRNKMYRLLSLCFFYPKEEFFCYAMADLLKDLEDSFKELPYFVDIQGIFEETWAVLMDQFAHKSLFDLQVDYTKLFIYPHGGSSCSPYESVYGGETRRFMTDTTMAVKRFYQNFSLDVSPQFKDLPDHIGAELEFMYFLSRNEEVFASRGDDEGRKLCMASEIEFLNAHLLRWVPQLATCLSLNSGSPLFIALSRFSSRFLVLDSEYLEKEPGNGITRSPITTSLEFEASTLTSLEKKQEIETKSKWVYTTSPERYWYSPVKIKVENGRAVQIMAREDIPFVDGKQDAKAFACFTKLYAVDKLKFPLKRVGERGEGKFKRITWDEALGEIASVLKRYRDEGNARYVAFLRTHPPMEFLFNHFAHHYGSPNDVHTSTTSCFADGNVAEEVTGGDFGKDDYLDAKYVLYIGHNLLCGIQELPQAARFAQALRGGMKFVFVDPRLNEGSYTYGSEWVPIKPGTDAAFILALMNVIISERLYDETFLLQNTNSPILIKEDGDPLRNEKGDYFVWDPSAKDIKPLDVAQNPALLGSYRVTLDTYQGVCWTAFQRLTERVEYYTPEQAELITSIGKAKITEIAHDLGTLKPRVSIFSRQNVSAQYSNSFQSCRARNVLMCLLGIFDKPGGKYFGPPGSTNIVLNRGSDFRIPIGQHPMTEDRVDFDPFVHSCINTNRKDYPLGSTQNVLKAIKTGEPYPIKALFIIGSDVLASQGREWREAFPKVEFIVKSHVWPDDDVDYADIVLPEAAYLERDEGFAQSSVHDPGHKRHEFSFLTVIQKVVEPLFEERSWIDYVKELAQKIGFGEAYDFMLDEYWDFLLAPMGIDTEYLRTSGVYYPPSEGPRGVEFGRKRRWKTDTGRLNVYGVDMVQLWHKKNHDPHYDPLPIYHPIKIEPKGENEFYLINGKCSYFKCNFYRDNALLLERYLEGELGNNLLWINSKKASELGIGDREWVWVESEVTGAKDKVRVKVTEGIHPSAVWHMCSAGHKSMLMDKKSRGREGINVNDFIPVHYVPWTAGAAHCEALVKIFKAEV